MENYYDILYSFLVVLGALALFYYGIKMMSEARQKLAGGRLKNMLSHMSRNRFMGLLVGVLITMIIQSSTATTVMVVSFVNAGVLTLSESIGVIMGTNIGTTITGWIMALFGFRYDITLFALPIIGLSLPMVLSSNNRRHSWGEILLGLSLTFLGLVFLRETIPVASECPDALEIVQMLSDFGVLSIILFVVVAGIMTIILRSSATSLTLTFVLCANGWLSLEMATAMIIGENIGTTITANVVALSGNISSRRAAMVHLIFNLLGALWCIIFFGPFLELNKLIIGTGPQSEVLTLALFHTMFNLCNSLIFIGFVTVIEGVVMRLKPTRESEEETFRLNFITTGLLSTSELSLVQAKKEISVFTKHTIKMYSFLQDMVFKENTIDKFERLFDKIEKYEAISDEFEIEIANYLTRVNQGKLSDDGRRKIRSMLRVIDEMENIGDSIYKCARYIDKMKRNHWTFPKEVMPKVELMASMLEESLEVMRLNIKDDEHPNLQKAKDIHGQISRYRDQIKTEHIDNIRNNLYTYEVGICYMDIIQECEILSDCVTKISEALSEFYEY